MFITFSPDFFYQIVRWNNSSQTEDKNAIETNKCMAKNTATIKFVEGILIKHCNFLTSSLIRRDLIFSSSCVTINYPFSEKEKDKMTFSSIISLLLNHNIFHKHVLFCFFSKRHITNKWQ